MAVVPGATAGYRPVAGLSNLVDAVLESGLPVGNPLWGRAAATNALIRPEDPTLPFSVFSTPISNAQISELDPDYVSKLLKQWAYLGNQYPETMNSLVGLGPTPSESFSSLRNLTATGNQAQLGVRSGLTAEDFDRRIAKSIRSGWNVGSQQTAGLAPDVTFMDPAASVGTHEFGHALQNRLGHFYDKIPTETTATKAYEDLLNQSIAENFNPHTAYSEYAQKGLERNLMHFMKPEVASLYDPADIANLREIGVKASSSTYPKITEAEVAKLPVYIRRTLAQEPLSEAFAMGRTPRYPLGAFERLMPQTSNALSASNVLNDAVNAAKAEGFRGAIAPELLFKGAGGLAAGLAAPKLIDYVTPGGGFLNRALKGAAAGAGYGSIAGPEGALVGAGLGALATQLNLPGVSSFLGA